MKNKLLLCLSIAFTANSLLAAEDNPLWMRYPSISPDGTQIAFCYKGDIYKVSSSGGQAVRLTTHSAYDYMPVWSPDGKNIAFASDRNGMGMNLYMMSSDGGEAKIYLLSILVLRRLIRSRPMASMCTSKLTYKTMLRAHYTLHQYSQSYIAYQLKAEDLRE